MGKPGQKISADDLVMMSPLFSVLPEYARTTVLERARPLSLDAGAPLYARGDPSDRYFGVLKGRLRLSVDSADGKTVALNQADTGEWFGELGLFEGGTRLVDATAAEPTDLVPKTNASAAESSAAESSAPNHRLDVESTALVNKMVAVVASSEAKSSWRGH